MQRNYRHTDRITSLIFRVEYVLRMLLNSFLAIRFDFLLRSEPNRMVFGKSLQIYNQSGKEQTINNYQFFLILFLHVRFKETDNINYLIPYFFLLTFCGSEKQNRTNFLESTEIAINVSRLTLNEKQH